MAKRVVGPVSWFGGPNDDMDSGRTAGGQTTATPGVAIRPGAHYESGRATLGGYWRITDPRTGKSAVLKQTDIGPNQSTGRRIDVTYSALKKFGYGEKDFPTDAKWKAEYLGKNPNASPSARSGAPSVPAGGSGLQAQARRQAAAQWLLSNSKSTADLQNRLSRIGAVATAQSAPSRVPAAGPRRASGPLSFVVGDSIAQGVAPKFGVRSSTQGGIGTAAGVSRLAHANPSGTVFVSLGANDDPHNVEQFRQQVRRALRVAPNATLVWATSANNPSLNRVLRQEVGRSGGRLRVADWTRSVRTSDGVHPADYGAYARSVRRSL